MSDLRTLSAAAFAPYVGAGFTLAPTDGTAAFSVTLNGWREIPGGTLRSAPRTAFSLYLVCPADQAPPFQDANCLLSHPEVGEIGPLHVIRVMPGAAGHDAAVYQISFN